MKNAGHEAGCPLSLPPLERAYGSECVCDGMGTNAERALACANLAASLLTPFRHKQLHRAILSALDAAEARGRHPFIALADCASDIVWGGERGWEAEHEEYLKKLPDALRKRFIDVQRAAEIRGMERAAGMCANCSGKGTIELLGRATDHACYACAPIRSEIARMKGGSA